MSDLANTSRHEGTAMSRPVLEPTADQPITVGPSETSPYCPYHVAFYTDRAEVLT
jgi:hypothetical protein